MSEPRETYNAPPAREYRFTVPGHPLSPNRRNAAPLRTRLADKKLYRDMVAWHCKRLHRGAPPLERAYVVITLCRTDGRFYDSDNAVGTVKHLADGLVVGGLLIDDDATHLRLSVRQGQGEGRYCHIHVRELRSDADEAVARAEQALEEG